MTTLPLIQIHLQVYRGDIEYDFGDFDQEATTSYEAHECWRSVFSMGLPGTSSMCALRKVRLLIRFGQRMVF